MSAMIDLTGQVFGRVTVVRRGPNTQHGLARWVCQCVCGTVTLVSGRDLRSGWTQSCGCYRSQQLLAALRTHGLHGHPLYARWKQMIARCHNHRCHGFAEYGGRGIFVTPAWHDVATYIRDVEQRIGLPPFARAGIDRINNDGHYEPRNIRWATAREQAQNMRPRRFAKRPS